VAYERRGFFARDVTSGYAVAAKSGHSMGTRAVQLSPRAQPLERLALPTALPRRSLGAIATRCCGWQSEAHRGMVSFIGDQAGPSGANSLRSATSRSPCQGLRAELNERAYGAIFSILAGPGNSLVSNRGA